MKDIFISHSSKDEPIVRAFIDDILIGALAVRVVDIFCTTTDGTKIKSGEDWRNSIKTHLEAAKITFIIVTPSYKESEVCLNEMGAAWVSSGLVLPLIVEPINYSTVGIIQQPKQIELLLEGASLDRVRDIVQDELEVPVFHIKSDRWSVKKAEFIEKTKRYLRKNPFLAPMSRDEFDKALEERDALREAYNELQDNIEEKEKIIEKLKRAKNKKEVKAIGKEYSDSTLLEQFEELAAEVYGCLEPLPCIVKGLVFADYSGKNIRVETSGWDRDISEAISKDYMDDELNIDWSSSRVMSDLHSALIKLEEMIFEGADDLQGQFEELYKSTYSVRNIDFWEEVFQCRVCLE